MACLSWTALIPSAGRIDLDSPAETIDRLTNLDFPMRGAIAALHGEARRIVDAPLCLSAAREILARVPEGGVVAILTGFPEFPWIRRGVAETDGPVGPCEPHFAPVIEAAVRGIGLVPIPAAGLDLKSLHPGDPVCLIEATDEAVDAERWLAVRGPALVIAIERPGRSVTGAYHNMSGRNVSHCLNNFEDLFIEAESRGIWTIGIGDGGNEVGMGALQAVVRAQVAAGSACGCGCGGGIAAVSSSRSLVTAVVANFGATAIAAMLALLTDDREALPWPALELQSLDACVAAGAVDGQHNECVASVDGLAADAYGAVLELIADAVDRARHRRSV